VKRVRRRLARSGATSQRAAPAHASVVRAIDALPADLRESLGEVVALLRARGVEVGFHTQHWPEKECETSPEPSAPDGECELLLRTLEVYREQHLPFQMRQNRDRLAMAPEVTGEELSLLTGLERLLAEHPNVDRKRVLALVASLLPTSSGPNASPALLPIGVLRTHDALVRLRGLTGNEAVRVIAERLDIDERKVRHYLSLARRASQTSRD